MAKEQKEQQNKKGGSGFIIALIVIVIAAVAGYFVFLHDGGIFSDKTEKKDSVKAPTEQATEFTVTPCDDEDVQLFAKSLPGKWVSYTDDGILYTYTFEKDGACHYEKTGKKQVDFTYTFQKGMLTLENPKQTYVYQCSKDAVGMMARMANGAWQNSFTAMAKKIPHFNGCVYIVDNIMYMGDKCLCKETALDKSIGKPLEGEWVGVVGDTVTFAADGTYTYVNHAAEFHGSYQVDFDKQTLVITLDGKDNDHDKTQWGIDGRVLHIGKQYYFKVS